MGRIWIPENLRNESLITKLSEHKGKRENEEVKKAVENVSTLTEICWKALLENKPVNSASKLKLHGSVTFKNFLHTKQSISVHILARKLPPAKLPRDREVVGLFFFFLIERDFRNTHGKHSPPYFSLQHHREPLRTEVLQNHPVRNNACLMSWMQEENIWGEKTVCK